MSKKWQFSGRPRSPQERNIWPKCQRLECLFFSPERMLLQQRGCVAIISPIVLTAWRLELVKGNVSGECHLEQL